MTAEFERDAATALNAVIRSRWLGEIESDPGAELFFPSGIPGFENEHRILPVEIPSQRPLVYLQSLEPPGVCFAALPVFVIDSGFHLRLSEEERSALIARRLRSGDRGRRSVSRPADLVRRRGAG